MGSILQPGFLFWDGAKYILTNTAPLSGPAGGDLAGTYPNPRVAKVNGVTVTGIPSIGQAIVATSSVAASWQTVASGGGSTTVLVYQPGGVAAGNIYTSWTALMTARTAIPSVPVTIVLDDSFSSPVSPDVGTWALNKNTAIIGSRGFLSNNAISINLVKFQLIEGAFFTDPVYFANIEMDGVQTPGNATPNFSATSNAPLCFDMVNCIFVTNQSSTPFEKPIFFISNFGGGTVNMFGFSALKQVSFGIPVISDDQTGNIVQNFILNLYDLSSVADHCIFFSNNGNDANLLVNIADGGAFYNIAQNSQAGTVSGGSSNASWSAAPTGSVLTKTAAATATWLTPARGYGRFFGSNPVPAVTLTPIISVSVTPQTTGVFRLLATGSVTDTSGAPNELDFKFSDGISSVIGTTVTAAANAKAGFAQVMDTDSFTGPYALGVGVTFTLQLYTQGTADAGNLMFSVQEV